MARPTINFVSGGIVTNASENYYFEVQPGVPYVMTLKGVFGGATIDLHSFINLGGGVEYTPQVTGGSWTADAEVRFVSPHAVMALFVGSATGDTNVAANFTPIRYTTK